MNEGGGTRLGGMSSNGVSSHENNSQSHRTRARP